jgi:hypothetical protein
MLKRYKSLNTIYYLREKLKQCDMRWFIEFIESNGLKALANASDVLGTKERVTFGDIGAQIELVLCWRTLMNREFVLKAYSNELAHTVPAGIEFALTTGNLMVRTRMFELFAAMTMVSSSAYKYVIHTHSLSRSLALAYSLPFSLYDLGLCTVLLPMLPHATICPTASVSLSKLCRPSKRPGSKLRA